MTRTDEATTAADALALPLAALASRKQRTEASGQTNREATEAEAALRRLAACHELRRLAQ